MGKTEKAEKRAYLKYIMLMNVPYHLDSSSDKNVKSCQDLLQPDQKNNIIYVLRPWRQCCQHYI